MRLILVNPHDEPGTMKGKSISLVESTLISSNELPMPKKPIQSPVYPKVSSTLIM